MSDPKTEPKDFPGDWPKFTEQSDKLRNFGNVHVKSQAEKDADLAVWLETTHLRLTTLESKVRMLEGKQTAREVLEKFPDILNPKLPAPIVKSDVKISDVDNRLTNDQRQILGAFLGFLFGAVFTVAILWATGELKL